jgi:hypothetical protein
MGWGGVTSTSSITNDSPAAHATAAVKIKQNKTKQNSSIN